MYWIDMIKKYTFKPTQIRINYNKIILHFLIKILCGTFFNYKA